MSADPYIYSIIARNNQNSNPAHVRKATDGDAGGKGKKRKITIHNYEGASLSHGLVSHNMRTIWIFPNPHTIDTNITLPSVLGPRLNDASYLHCIQQPAFKFRMVTKPFEEHKGECDKGGIRHGPIGTVKEHMLLTSLISTTIGVIPPPNKRVRMGQSVTTQKKGVENKIEKKIGGGGGRGGGFKKGRGGRG